jgi:hypothetical protein
MLEHDRLRSDSARQAMEKVVHRYGIELRNLDIDAFEDVGEIGLRVVTSDATAGDL